MAQNDYGNPQSPFSGTQLNATLRNWRDALHTLHRGTSRPSYAQGGTLWVREVSSTNWELTFYDGADDILIATINPSANTVTPAGAATPADLNTRVPLAGNVTVSGWLGVANATAGTHAVNRDTGDARYARLAAANTFTAPNTFNDFITLHADPTAAMHPATKQYVDRLIGDQTPAISTPSGTAYDVTGIPSWANRLEILVRSITTTTQTFLRVQLGTSNGLVTSGYVSGSGTRGSEISDTTAFGVFWGVGNAQTGICVIRRYEGNIWISSHAGIYGAGFMNAGAGHVTLPGALTQMRLTLNAGNFSGGAFVLRWSA